MYPSRALPMICVFEFQPSSDRRDACLRRVKSIVVRCASKTLCVQKLGTPADMRVL